MLRSAHHALIFFECPQLGRLSWVLGGGGREAVLNTVNVTYCTLKPGLYSTAWLSILWYKIWLKLNSIRHIRPIHMLASMIHSIGYMGYRKLIANVLQRQTPDWWSPCPRCYPWASATREAGWPTSCRPRPVTSEPRWTPSTTPSPPRSSHGNHLQEFSKSIPLTVYFLSVSTTPGWCPFGRQIFHIGHVYKMSSLLFIKMWWTNMVFKYLVLINSKWMTFIDNINKTLSR